MLPWLMSIMALVKFNSTWTPGQSSAKRASRSFTMRSPVLTGQVKRSRTAILLGQRLDILLRLARQREDLAGLLIEGPARFGEAESASGTLQQLGIEGRFQCADVTAQHPLAHPRLSAAVETALCTTS